MTKHSTIINHSVAKCKPAKNDYYKLDKIKRKSIDVLQKTIDEKMVFINKKKTYFLKIYKQYKIV